MTTLLLDIGNSRIKWGTLINGAVCNTNYLPLRDVVEDVGLLQRKLPDNVESAFACNVAGDDVASAISGFFGNTYGKRPHFVRPSAFAAGVRTAYSQPERLGVDR